jgi:hypothetical protein
MIKPHKALNYNFAWIKPTPWHEEVQFHNFKKNMADYRPAISTEADKLVSTPTQEHVLVLFVVLRALFDIKRGSDRERRDAEGWIKEKEDTEPFSFKWCCECLSDYPDVLHNACYKYAVGQSPWPFLRFGGRREKNAA